MNIAVPLEWAKQHLEEMRRSLRKSLDEEPSPPGLVRPDDETFMQWVMAMQQKFPPQPFRTPFGTTVVESAWVLMLPYVAGGDAVLARINEIKKKAVA